MRNIKLLIQYEGTRYQGWQRQENSDNTIQGKMEKLLSMMCGEKIELQGSGRTDAGVHAAGQVANFYTNSTMTKEEMLSYINEYLPKDIAVIGIEEVGERFHSRLHAKGKCYVYRVINSSCPDVFWRRFALEFPEKLDLEAMREAADLLCGEHDFRSFTSAGRVKKSTVRRVDAIRIEKKENLVTFTFHGNGFLYHMVRIMMGTLLEVGTGKRDPQSVLEILRAKDRQKAGYLVPAKGLMLEKVFYDTGN